MLAGALATAATASAQFANTSSKSASTGDYTGYNRIGISYNNTHFGYNKNAGGSDSNFSLNGVGIDYIHGFGLTSNYPIFLEVGLNATFNFGSDSEEGDKDYFYNDYWMRSKYTSKKQFINLQVPVNFVYRFQVTDDWTIAPYLGLNFKLNVVGKFRTDLEIDHNVPSNLLSQAGIRESDLKEEGEWQNVFDKDDMGSNDNTWNRFQMGWHIGCGFQYKPFYLGIQYGTDFIPAFKYEKAKVNTGNLKISLGYSF